MTYESEMKLKSILDFLKKSGDVGISQGDIARALLKELMYASEDSARVSIGKLMIMLEEKGLVYYIEKKSKRGSIGTKVWHLTKPIPEV